MLDMPAIARESLDQWFKTMLPVGERPADRLERPPKGWILAIREALEMSQAQLAARLGVSRPRVAQIEDSEIADALTLKTLRHVAEALDCKLVYALVPNKPLEATVRERKASVAKSLMWSLEQTMRLEAQDKGALSEKSLGEILSEALKNKHKDKP